MSETKSETVKVTLEISQRDYDIIYKVAVVRGENIEDMAFEGLKSMIESYMQEGLGEMMGFGEHGNYDHVFEDKGGQHRSKQVLRDDTKEPKNYSPKQTSRIIQFPMKGA